MVAQPCQSTGSFDARDNLGPPLLPPRPPTPFTPDLLSWLCTVAIKWPCMAACRQAERYIAASKVYDVHGHCIAKPNLTVQHSLCLCNKCLWLDSSGMAFDMYVLSLAGCPG